MTGGLGISMSGLLIAGNGLAVWTREVAHPSADGRFYPVCRKIEFTDEFSIRTGPSLRYHL